MFFRNAGRVLFFMFCCTQPSTNADAGVVFSTGLTDFGLSDIVNNLGYPGTVGTTVSYESGIVTAADGMATFRIGYSLTPSGGALSPNGSEVGVNSGMSDPDDDGINLGESIAFGGLTVLEFDSGGGGLTVADVTALQFTTLLLDGSTGSNDQGSLSLNGGALIDWDDTNNGSLVVGESENQFDLFIANSDVSVTTFVLSGRGGTTSSFRASDLIIAGMTPATAVPEPSSIAFFCLGAVGVALRRRSARSRCLQDSVDRLSFKGS